MDTDCWRHRVDGGVCGGRLNAKKLVSLWGIPELRFIEWNEESVSIGAATTFRDLRAAARIAVEFPLLAQSAGWIGSIANQSRATLGGNLANGSPAADSSPVLLAYDAEVETISARGRRRFPYSAFHTGYKRNVLAPDELLFALHLPAALRGTSSICAKWGRGGQWLSRRSL